MHGSGQKFCTAVGVRELVSLVVLQYLMMLERFVTVASPPFLLVPG